MSLGRHTVYRSERLKIDFELNRKGIRQIALSKPLRDATNQVALERAMPYAISISPRDSGTYASSFQVVETFAVRGASGYRMRRVAARLQNNAPHAAIVEWGNKRAKPYLVLTETLGHLTGNTDPSFLAGRGISRASRGGRDGR